MTIIALLIFAALAVVYVVLRKAIYRQNIIRINDTVEVYEAGKMVLTYNVNN